MPLIDDWHEQAGDGHPDDWKQRIRDAFIERDQIANSRRDNSAAGRTRVREVIADFERSTAARAQPGDWRPDEWDLKARAIVDYRDRIADSIDGPVPAFGSPEWAVADWRTQLASYARHEREVAAAQGRAISDRMAAESARREAQGEAEKAIAAECARRGYSDPSQQLRPSVRDQRDADRKHRAEQPKPWEDGYAASFPGRPQAEDDGSSDSVATGGEADRAGDEGSRARSAALNQTRADRAARDQNDEQVAAEHGQDAGQRVPAPRQPADAGVRGSVQRAATAAACAKAQQVTRAAVTAPAVARPPAHHDAGADGDVDVRA